MKTLKLTTVILATALVFGSISSCKYEEGPALSLRTKKARLAGEWIIEKYEDEDGSGTNVDESDSPVFTFEKDGSGSATYSYTFGGATTTTTWDFTWEFTDSKKKLKITDEDGDFTSDEILRLTNKELWTKDSDGDKTFWKAK